MIALNVRNLVIARGVKPRDVCSYLRSLDISEKVAKGIASGSRKSLTLNQVEILCYKLKVVPNDLYLWSADRQHPYVEGHPINQIKAGDPLPDIITESKDLPIEDLRKVHNYIEQLKKKDKK